MHYTCVLTQPSLGGMRHPPETNLWRAGWQRKTQIMAALSFFRSGGMPDESSKKLHKLTLIRAQVPVFPTIEVPDPGFEVLQENEQDEILEKIPDFDRPIFGFILQYATRPSEARAIKRDAVIGDFDKIVIRRTFTRNNRLKDNPKEGKWRSISLVEETKGGNLYLPLLSCSLSATRFTRSDLTMEAALSAKRTASDTLPSFK